MLVKKGRPLPIGEAKKLPKAGTQEAKALSAKTAPKTKVKSAASAGEKPKAQPTGQTGTFEGYCVKCKEKNVKFTGEIFESVNGNRIAKGPHTCGTTVCRILGKQQ